MKDDEVLAKIRTMDEVGLRQFILSFRKVARREIDALEAKNTELRKQVIRFRAAQDQIEAQLRDALIQRSEAERQIDRAMGEVASLKARLDAHSG